MSKNVTLLVEMPGTLGHIVVKRKRLLRDGGSSGANVLLKEKDFAWLKTAVGSRGTEANAWDAAHETAAKIKKEFGKDVYVEPEGQAGRFQERMMPESMMMDEDQLDGPGSFVGAGGNNGMHGFDNPLLRQMQNLNGFGVNLAGGKGAGMFPGISGMPGMPGSGGRNQLGIGGNGMDPMAGLMPHIPSVNDFIPNFLDGQDGQNSQEGRRNKASLSFEPIQNAMGFEELPEASKKMFEVEAAQVMASGINVGIAITDGESALMALALQPTISKALKRFLEKALAVPARVQTAVSASSPQSQYKEEAVSS